MQLNTKYNTKIHNFSGKFYEAFVLFLWSEISNFYVTNVAYS